MDRSGRRHGAAPAVWGRYRLLPVLSLHAFFQQRSNIKCLGSYRPKIVIVLFQAVCVCRDVEEGGFPLEGDSLESCGSRFPLTSLSGGSWRGLEHGCSGLCCGRRAVQVASVRRLSVWTWAAAWVRTGGGGPFPGVRRPTALCLHLGLLVWVRTGGGVLALAFPQCPDGELAERSLP